MQAFECHHFIVIDQRQLLESKLSNSQLGDEVSGDRLGQNSRGGFGGGGGLTWGCEERG
jgi:hypothetical protein